MGLSKKCHLVHYVQKRMKCNPQNHQTQNYECLFVESAMKSISLLKLSTEIVPVVQLIQKAQ